MASLSESFVLATQPQHAEPLASPSSSTVALLASKTLTLFSLNDNSTLATLDVPPNTSVGATRLVNGSRWIAVAPNDQISHSLTLVKKDGTFAATPEFASFKAKASVKALVSTDLACFYLDEQGRLDMAAHHFSNLSHVKLKLSKPISKAKLSVYPQTSAPFAVQGSHLVVCIAFHTGPSIAGSPVKKKNKKQKDAKEPPKEQTASLSLVAVNEGALRVVKTIELPSKDITDVAVTASGHIAVLHAEHAWEHFKLDAANQLQPLRSLALNQDILIPVNSACTHLLPLKASFILLAAQSKQSPEQLTFSIWDLQHGVALCKTVITLSSDHSHFSVAYGPAILVLSHTTATEARIYGIACECPSSSTLSLIVGKSSLTLPFLAPVDAQASRTAEEKRRQAQKHPLISEEKSKLVDDAAQARLALLDAAQQDPSRIDDLFDGWLSSQMDALEQYEQFKTEKHERMAKDREGPAAAQSEKTAKKRQRKRGVVEGDVEMGPAEDKGAHVPPTTQDAQMDDVPAEAPSLEVPLVELHPHLPGPFVTKLLALIMDDTANPFPTDTLAYLLERRSLSDAYVAGGLAKTLYDRQQWPLVQIALQSLPDIPESDLIAILKSALKNPPPDFTTQEVVSSIVQYRASAKPLQAELAAQLEPAEVKAILEIIAMWLSDTELTSLPPPLRPLIDFLTCLLDGHFVSLLQDTSCHALVEEINTAMGLAVQVTSNWVSLKGPVESVERELKRSLDPNGAPVEVGEYTIETLDI